MDFNLKNYKLFCYNFNLIPSRYKNLKIFKEYCNGNYDIIFKIIKQGFRYNTFISSYCVTYEKMV